MQTKKNRLGKRVQEMTRFTRRAGAGCGSLAVQKPGWALVFCDIFDSILLFSVFFVKKYLTGQMALSLAAANCCPPSADS